MTRTLAALTLALALLAPPVPALAQNAHDLLQQALRKERVEGDLPAAIALYRRIVAEHPEERTAVASALVRLGRAHESRDPAEAERLYERVVSGYADQADAAAAALERLAVLQQASGADANAAQQRLTELPFRGWAGSASSSIVALSNDGTRLAHVDRDRDLALYDLRTGRSTKLVRGEGGIAWYPVWSPDDRRIAYQRARGTTGRRIEIVTLEGGSVRDAGREGIPRSWGRDGMILAISQDASGSESPVWLVPEGGGEARNVPMDHAPSDLPALSPDGAHLAYASNVDGNVDIYVAPTAGGEHVRVTSEPGVETRPMWSADGTRLVFKSDRKLNRMGLWAVAMDGGRPAGQPLLVRPDVGEGEPISWSRDGKLLFTTLRSVAHVHSVGVAPPFEMLGTALKLTESPDWNREPFVSPDGTRIIYHASSGNNAVGERVLRVMGVDGSGGRDVVTDLGLPYRALAGWINDDEVVVAGPRRNHPERGVYAVSTSTGALRPLLVSDEVYGMASVSPDRSRVLFLYGKQDPRFHVIGVDGGGLTLVTSTEMPDGIALGVIPRWSPDGRWITYVERGRRGIVAVNLETGEQRRLVTGDSLILSPDHRWTPDGRYLVYSAKRRGTDEPASGWAVPSDGSGAFVPVPFDLQAAPAAVRSVSSNGIFTTFNEDWQWTPDGSAMVFTVSSAFGQGWIMENFLPEGSAARD